MFYNFFYKIDTINQMRTTPSKLKAVIIGWKHRYSETSRYISQKGRSAGNREFKLDVNNVYSVKDLIDMGKQAYKDERAQDLFNESSVELGFYNEQVIPEFTLANGIKCGLWEYYTYSK